VDQQVEEALNELKKRLTSVPVLTLPINEENFLVHSDTSKNELGCALMQSDQL